MPSSYVIGEHFEQFIKGQLQQGRYASASEVIRDGLRALEDREKLRAAKLEALRADIQQWINAGPGRPVQQVTAELQARYQNWAGRSGARHRQAARHGWDQAEMDDLTRLLISPACLPRWDV